LSHTTEEDEMSEQSAEADVRRLSQAWARAEVHGDVATLEGLTAADFTLVGPVGFVLDRRQWLDRYRDGTLTTSELAYADVDVRVYGDAAVSVGVHTQKAAFRGSPADGSFRATHVAVRAAEGWRLAGMHLSPIGGPPPFAARPDTGEDRES
jgi:ketosteroid isomerase-like protein